MTPSMIGSKTPIGRSPKCWAFDCARGSPPTIHHRGGLSRSGLWTARPGGQHPHGGHHPRYGSGGEPQEWTLFAIGFESLVQQFFEIDPDWSPGAGGG